MRRLFGPRADAPWPTGLRLLPPEGRADAPRDVALVEVRRFETGDDDVFGLAPLPGGRFVSGGTDGVLRLWSVDQATPLAELRGHEDRINRIAALDGGRVVTASSDRRLILWDLEARAARETFRGHQAAVRDVAPLDRDRFVSVANADDCRLWSTARAQADRVWTFDDPNGVAALAPDRVVTGGYKTIMPDVLLDDYSEEAATFGDRLALARDRQGLTQAQLARRLGLRVQTIRNWESDRSEPRANKLQMLATFLNVSMVWLMKADTYNLRLLDPGSDTPLARITEDGAELWKAAAVTARRVLTVGRRSPELRLWDWESGACAAALTGDAACQDVALLSTVRAVSAHDDGAMLWSLPDGACLARATPGSRLLAVRALPPAPGGPARVVLGGDDGYLALWEVRPAGQAAS